MADISDMKASEFSESVLITPATLVKGKLTIRKAERIVFKKGLKAGKEGLVLGLEQDGAAYSYFPNKTSISTLASLFGNNTDKWMGKSIELTTESIMVQGKKQNALFVKDN